jgi:HAD superfamily hydrolase (TIGR01549 family)
MAPTIPPGRTPAVQRAIPQPVITFDAGQTLIELDLDFLAGRLAERDIHVTSAALAAALPAAWRHYDAMVSAANGHPWQAWMGRLLEGAGVYDVEPHVDWLWSEQQRANLWRKPISDMVALAGELAARGLLVAVLSNSEGKLAELLAEIGIAGSFTVIIDSTRLGIAKPDRRIFDHALAVTGATAGIHIGDSWSTDIAGALGAGWRAIWYGGHAVPDGADGRVAIARDAAEVRAALVRFGV